MDNTEINLENKEISAVWDSNEGSCSEAPCEAAEPNPVEQRAGGTHLTGEEHLSIGGGRTIYREYYSFNQANLQHSIAASRILTRTVGVKVIDIALIQ
jgi:hypothetical protein